MAGFGSGAAFVFTLRVVGELSLWAIIFLRITLGFGAGFDACSQLHTKVSRQINQTRFRMMIRYFFIMCLFGLLLDSYFLFFFFFFFFFVSDFGFGGSGSTNLYVTAVHEASRTRPSLD